MRFPSSCQLSSAKTGSQCSADARDVGFWLGGVVSIFGASWFSTAISRNGWCESTKMWAPVHFQFYRPRVAT